MQIKTQIRPEQLCSHPRGKSPWPYVAMCSKVAAFFCAQVVFALCILLVLMVLSGPEVRKAAFLAK